MPGPGEVFVWSIFISLVSFPLVGVIVYTIQGFLAGYEYVRYECVRYLFNNTLGYKCVTLKYIMFIHRVVVDVVVVYYDYSVHQRFLKCVHEMTTSLINRSKENVSKNE